MPPRSTPIVHAGDTRRHHTLASVPQEPDDRHKRPEYKVYRSRRRLLGARKEREPDRPYSVHRAGPERPRIPLPSRRGRRAARAGAGLTLGRVARLAFKAAIAWTLLSLLLFLVSAQIGQSQVSDAALDPGGYPLTSPSTILVLGSDARTEKTSEPGSQVGGPSRSDSIMLLRTGGGASARLSIPRDTVVEIPGRGRDKINAAFAIGGVDLAVTTIKGYLGIEVNHVVQVDFANFPALIDAMGGIDIRTGCVVSRINGGFKNGGYTLRLRPGDNHIDGRQALALARTRKNECRRSEGDVTRARRQQKIFAAMKSRLVSPATFLRLPWVSWQAPRALRSDMGGPSLLGLFGAIATSGSPKTRVLKPSGNVVLPDGGSGLTVSESEIESERRRFLDG